MPPGTREERSLASALYLVAAYAVVAPFLYEAQRLIPPQVGDADWRFGAGGFFLDAWATPILGLAAALALGWYQARPGVLRFTAVVALVAAAVTALVWALFFREYLAMRPGVPEAGLGVFTAATVRSLVTGGIAVPLLFLLGLTGWRLAHAQGSAPSTRPSALRGEPRA